MKIRLITFHKLISLLLFCPTVCLAVETPNGPYFGQEPPGMTPQVFVPGFISLNNRYEYGFALSPNGQQVLFMQTNSTWGYFQILYTEMDEEGNWSNPTVPSFCQGYQNLYPSFSYDGQTLFFASPRPSAPPFDSDLYTTQWTGDDWTEPEKIPAPISRVGTREYRASVTQDGTLYYTSNGIYRAPFVNGRYGTPERLPTVINGDGLTGSPFIAPDESYLIFESGRPGGHGLNDLYISFRQGDGSWDTPRNLGPVINTEGIEDSGFVTHDGKYFIFCRRAAYTTNIQTDIHWVDIRVVLPDPNGPIENLSSGMRFGSIQCAINYADEGDTIVINPGVYRESIIIIGKTIVLKSINPNDSSYIGATIIQGNPDSPVVTLNENPPACEIAGLTIRAGSIGIAGNATDATIRNCRIMDNTTHGIELSQESKPNLLNCLIAGNGQTGITMLAGTGRGSPPCTPLIDNCVIVQNSSENIVGGQPTIIDSIVD